MVHHNLYARRIMLTASSTRRCFSGAGRISRMLDMGGMPGASNTKVKPINASKNNQLQVVAFDFDLLTRSTTPPPASQEEGDTMKAETQDPNTGKTEILPKVGMVQDIANLLNVQLGGESPRRQRHNDDLSALTGEVHTSSENQTAKSAEPSAAAARPHIGTDIRAKYADRLRNRLDGGIATVERVKQDLASGVGDADGHLSARNIAIQQGSTQQTKWMALTGTGALLQYLSNRNMKLCLLPTVSQEEDTELEEKRMREFETQLPRVQIDMVAKFPDTDDDTKSKGDTRRMQPQQRVTDLIQTVTQKLDVMDPKFAMIVSDRDDYLRAAKDLGWVVCRYRATSNARRGIVSEHYLIRSIPEVQDVVDEINGISFNALRQ